jgi:asparaginyl-tRNA synthetase
MSTANISPLSSAKSLCGSTITVLGYAESIRIGKNMSFIVLKYGQTKVPIVSHTNETTKTLTPYSYIQVTGLVTQIPKRAYCKFSTVEIQSENIVVLSLSDNTYSSRCPPTSGPEVKLLERHLYFRDPKFGLITALRAKFLQAIRDSFRDSDCLEIIPPSFTGVECEGGASLFKVEHPGICTAQPMTAFLTQSSQFALEMALPGVGDCYCIAPSFRAENSHTRRHLTEFTHCEAEWGGILTMGQHLSKLECMLISIVSKFLSESESLLKQYDVDGVVTGFDRVSNILEMCKSIVTLTHKNAIVECTKLGIYKYPSTETEEAVPFSDRDDIPEAQERALIDSIGKVVFLVGFPRESKSFYFAMDPTDPSRVLGCDVEVPGVGEIIGSGVREADHTKLTSRMVDCNLNPDDYKEYLDLRKFGFGYTSGMGLGVDRMFTWLLGCDSIRQVSSFPRFPGYLRP